MFVIGAAVITIHFSFLFLAFFHEMYVVTYKRKKKDHFKKGIDRAKKMTAVNTSILLIH